MIVVDADACPVKHEVYRVARRYDLEVLLVAARDDHDHAVGLGRGDRRLETAEHRAGVDQDDVVGLPRPRDDVLFFFVIQLAKPATALDTVAVLRHKMIDRLLQETDAFSAVKQQTPIHQPLLTPA